MSSYNNRFNIAKKKRRYVSYDGQTLWDTRNPGETPLFSRADWMIVPREAIARDHGPKKRRIEAAVHGPVPVDREVGAMQGTGSRTSLLLGIAW
jgi:hypothetical protein